MDCSGISCFFRLWSNESTSKKGKVYLREYPKIRLAKTIFNFNIAVLLYLLMNGILSIKYSVMDIAGSFVGITSVGNSNWYIFTVLVMYVLSYMCPYF